MNSFLGHTKVYSLFYVVFMERITFIHILVDPPLLFSI